MKKEKKKIIQGRHSLSFSLAELAGRLTLTLDTAGVMMGRPAATDTAKKCVEASFGRFDNLNQFTQVIESSHPVAPKPEDYVDVPFRLLTATTVGAYSYKATDFSDAVMLEASMNMLLGKPVYKNHDTDVNSWIGFIKEVKWTPAFTAEDGTRVPAGIDGILSIDSKVDPVTVRGLLCGAIYSNSVTVEFDWKSSHEFANASEFSMNVGKMMKGTMVRRIATVIMNYHETSLVFLGADPFAKLINDKGALTNIDKSSISYDKATEEDKIALEKGTRCKVEFALDAEIISLSSEKFKHSPIKENTMHPFLIALAKMLNIKPEEITAEHAAQFTLVDPAAVALSKKAGLLDTIIEAVDVVALDKPTDKTKVTLTGEKETTGFDSKFVPKDYIMLSRTDFAAATKAVSDLALVQTERDGLKKENGELAAEAALGKEYQTLQREEGKRVYKLAAGDKVDNAVIELFDKADGKAVVGLLNSYVKGATFKFGGRCAKCQSTEFEFRSSFTGEDTTKEKVDPSKTVGFEDIHKKYNSGSMDITKKTTTGK